MVVAAFPLAKLAYLGIRQVSKPIAAGIKNRAKASPFFRNYICMPPAQFYHWADVKIKLWVLNMGGPVKVAKLNEEQAIEQGAEILGETVIFGIAAICLILDYMRSARKEAAKEVAAQERLKKMENGIFEIGMLSERQDAQIRELTRALMALKPKGVNLKEYEAMHVDIKFEPQPDPAAHSVEPDIDHHK